MISKMAIDDIEQLKSEGLEPTYEDIIRLNELALVYESYKKKNTLVDSYVLPRVAQIDDRKWFRQPTVGHEIWIDKVREWLATDYNTVLALYAYALSRDYTQLPEANDIESVKQALSDYTEEMKGYMRFQISEAISYVVRGCEPRVGVLPEHKSTFDEQEMIAERGEMCIALGVLNEGKAVLWGMSEYELKMMTRRQLQDTIKRAYLFHGMQTDDNADTKLNEYYRTYDKIKERLMESKKLEEQ